MTNLPAIPSSNAVEGLEDFDQDDIVMPKIELSHKKGKYVDSLSSEEFESLDIVLLGLVKQRVLWDPEMDDNPKPLCKSYDHKAGVPGEDFPWTASGFAQVDYPEVDGAASLPCDKCALAEWGSHPKNDTPWCTEQHTFVLALPTGESFSPAVLTVQRTAIKASKAYLTSFHRSQSPLFVARTKLGLDLRKKGNVDYAVPTFTRGAATDEEDHELFAQTYRRIRAYLQTPRTSTEDVGTGETTTPVANPGTPPAAASFPDDEEPF
jgi:hypothetical protein